ncbi:serine hydrolase [Pontimicrobium aquaticum]|uniref:Serine hydrolase n=1 Tax=Pontimicrobium aquaticum TaxID=2565367 RepID=A0A4U0EW88_9FLAO|nr:serine hydrolase [Pontimicrobium aquaticum]TJY36207.1 serine hydrolase [Pontimicrobium aquaticum]
MKKLFLLVFSICTILPVLSQTDNRLKNIDSELNKVLEATKTPGFAVAVVEGDNVIYAKGFGYRDYANKIPVDANTLFAIGSSTKAFTSAILGKLRAEDKLSFDDSPLDYIPDLKFYNNDMNNNIIIKDLMRHSTGLPRHDLSWYYFPTHSKDSLIKRVQYQEPFTGVRQQWYYNNFMFLAQGVIAEKITGKSWEDNISDMFFKPLGMSRSNSTIAEMKSASNAAYGYELKKGDVISKMDYYDIAGMSPAGSINSSVNDMSKWLITWINKGKFNDTEIIPEAYITEAMSSQMVINGTLPDEELPDMHFANYGYGWMLQSYRGHYRVEHGGNIDGFSASVAFFPTDKIGIVVLTNQNGSAATGLVRNTIADRMLGGKTTDWVKRFTDSQEKNKKAQEEAEDNSSSSKVANTKPSHAKLDYTGTYSNPGYGKLDIIVENDSLFTILNNNKQYVNHYHYDTFELIDIVDNKLDTTQIGNALKITFKTNDTGDISGATFKTEPTLDAIMFKRTPNTIEVSLEDLNKYVGDFELAGMILKVYVKNESLYFFVPGQPEYELVATAEHKFNFKIVDGFKIEFLKNGDNDFDSIKVIQPQGNFIAKRKK